MWQTSTESSLCSCANHSSWPRLFRKSESNGNHREMWRLDHPLLRSHADWFAFSDSWFAQVCRRGINDCWATLAVSHGKVICVPFRKGLVNEAVGRQSHENKVFGLSPLISSSWKAESKSSGANRNICSIILLGVSRLFIQSLSKLMLV